MIDNFNRRIHILCHNLKKDISITDNEVNSYMESNNIPASAFWETRERVLKDKAKEVLNTYNKVKLLIYKYNSAIDDDDTYNRDRYAYKLIHIERDYRPLC